jgi:membrane protein implicated in regulation of membrane protease activity
VSTIESATLGWAALAILTAVVELLVPHFGVIFASMGALAATITALLSFGFPVQLTVFVAVTALSLALLRQRLVRRGGRTRIPGRAEGLVGREGVVTSDIEVVVGAGRVNVGGEDWAARAASPLPTGTRVKVIGHDGIVLEVAPA